MLSVHPRLLLEPSPQAGKQVAVRLFALEQNES